MSKKHKEEEEDVSDGEDPLTATLILRLTVLDATVTLIRSGVPVLLVPEALVLYPLKFKVTGKLSGSMPDMSLLFEFSRDLDLTLSDLQPALDQLLFSGWQEDGMYGK